MDLSNNPAGNRASSSKTLLLVIFILVVLIVAAAAGAFYFYPEVLGRVASLIDMRKQNPVASSLYGGALADIGSSSDAYTQAVIARQEGDYRTAISEYNRALEEVVDVGQRAQINYEIGVALNYIGDPIGAIERLKAVAADETLPPVLRAYAVQQIGEVYYWRSDQASFNEIFSSEPYAGMRVPGNKGTSLKNLFEYASSLYPLAYAEMKIAQYYANTIVNVKERGLLLSGEGLSVEDMTRIVHEKVASAERDVNNIRAVYPSDIRISSFFQRKAVVAGIMYRAGDTALGDPDQLFEQAFEAGFVQGSINQTAFTLYNHAVFLAKTDPEGQKEKIISLLRNLYVSDKFTSQSSILEFFRNENISNGSNRDDISLLASIDPDFRSLLRSLGWVL